MDDSFYVHLCSSDSLGTYPKNTGSNFVNLLASPLDLSIGYEVGITEFQYTNDLYNVTENSNFAIFDFLYEWKSEGSDDVKYGRLYDGKVEEGNYTDVEDFCQILNQLVSNMKIKRLDGIKLFSYDSISKKFHLNVKNLYITIIVKEHLINILGLTQKEGSTKQVVIIGKAKDKKSYMYKGKERFFRNQRDHWDTDSEQGGVAKFTSQMIVVSSLLIYSPIIGDSIFGSSFVRLLRIVPMSGRSNERVVQSFNPIIYYPVRESTITYI